MDGRKFSVTLRAAAWATIEEPHYVAGACALAGIDLARTDIKEALGIILNLICADVPLDSNRREARQRVLYELRRPLGDEESEEYERENWGLLPWQEDVFTEAE